jgi:hypothetical protein
MKNNKFLTQVTTTIILATLAFACKSTDSKTSEQSKATENPQSQLKIVYGDFVIKEKSDYLMIPVYLAKTKSSGGINLASSREYQREETPQNFVFYHKQNGETHLLLNKKAIIKSFDLLEPKDPKKSPAKFWLYKIIDQDTNQDKELNKNDAIIGYLSDLSGKNLQQITPDNTQVISWLLIPSQNAIFLKIIKDANNDKQFTELDKTNFVRVNLDQPGMGTEIISDQIEQQIKSYF